MSTEYRQSVSNRYIELYENIAGEKFIKADPNSLKERIEKNVVEFLNNV